MKLRYQYRIYPTKQQQTDLAKLFGCCRVVWNDALAWVLQTPEDQAWPTNAELQKLCITLAKQYPQREWLSEVSNIPLQQSLADLGTAFKNFFESRNGKRKGEKMGFPGFKKKDNRQSARFRKGGFSIEGNKVYLAKVGAIKTKWSRPLPTEPSSITVIKDRAGRYFISCVVEVAIKPLAALADAVGVDLGIKTFAVLSTGDKIDSPDYSKLNRKIKRAQRHLSRCQKGSNRWHCARLRVAKLKAKIRDVRKDFLHKLSTHLIRNFGVICLEDLNVKGMVKNRRLARAISEAGWSEFRTMCEAKAGMYARDVSVISRWEPTSQTCFECGYRWGKLDLSVREITCLGCGTHHDRDGNAAVNIKQVGVGHNHDSKRTVNECETGQSSSSTALSNQLVEVQLSLSF
ncbi:transposase [Leptolyngbyaceae cyanobacterium CCMR0082]|uniref:Transposase n=1 Tax=Adonisia turfae CCMR0082 TaxID=2304604 RepID=A0A6M0SDS2_9CYAN|nr:RNA-guided endonuclease TnpB family protein [Adonisia turfae]NEZ66639.1 transposase [Adonisia turfae CCMR0082]